MMKIMKKQKLTFPRPCDEVMCSLLGGCHWDGVNLTNDQVAALSRHYDGISVEDNVRETRANFEAAETARKLKWEEDFKKDPYRTPKPFEHRYFEEEAIRALYTAGRNKGTKTAASFDGLRLMAFLARFLERGEDPVRLVEGLMMDAGFDVTDGGWPEEEEDEG